MGCFNSKSQFSDEEEALVQETEALGFNKCSTAEVDLNIRKYSSEEKINRNQLKSLCSTLNLNLKNYDTHMNIEKFMDQLKLTPDFYDAQRLLIIGILLSTGSDERKAQNLFQVMDRDETGSIDSSKSQVLLEKWIDCILNLGLLVGDAQNHRSSQEKSAAYINKCRQAKKRWLYSMKNSLGAGFVTRDTFIRCTTSFKGGVLIEPRSFRSYLAKDALENPENKRKVSLNVPLAKFRKPAEEA
mmetsp:Transcript_7324/g.13549  ORF Transcript_7324/g.13549 Transcript_7324/m.13549 type:complete len:243 (+) Transcript_7324:215-943(+)